MTCCYCCFVLLGVWVLVCCSVVCTVPQYVCLSPVASDDDLWGILDSD